MLVLTRKVGEGVTLTIYPSDSPTQIHVVLINRQNGHAAIGFECDEQSVKILRDELVPFAKEDKQ